MSKKILGLSLTQTRLIAGEFARFDSLAKGALQ